MLPLLFLIVPATWCNPESHQALIHVRQSLQHIPGHKILILACFSVKLFEMCLHHLSFDSPIPNAQQSNGTSSYIIGQYQSRVEVFKLIWLTASFSEKNFSTIPWIWLSFKWTNMVIETSTRPLYHPSCSIYFGKDSPVRTKIWSGNWNAEDCNQKVNQQWLLGRHVGKDVIIYQMSARHHPGNLTYTLNAMLRTTRWGR